MKDVHLSDVVAAILMLIPAFVILVSFGAYEGGEDRTPRPLSGETLMVGPTIRMPEFARKKGAVPKSVPKRKKSPKRFIPKPFFAYY